MSSKQAKSRASTEPLKSRSTMHNEQTADTVNSRSTIDIQCPKDLELRVHFWAGKGNLNHELNEALIALRKHPKVLSNYLVSGVLYSMQGHYADAHHVLKQAIAMVASNDPLNPVLNEWNHKAKARMHHQVNVIAQTPYDILIEIARYFTRKDLITCFQVCRLWRSKWVEVPNHWRTIRLRGSYPDDEKPRLGVLPLVSQHIEDVSFKMEPYKIICNLELIATLDLPNLSSFSLFCDYDTGWYTGDSGPKPSLLINKIYETLSHVGKNLTTLKLDLRETRKRPLTLEHILPYCPNLNTLLCRCDTLIDWYSGAWLTWDTQLTHLHLDAKPVLRSITVKTLLRRSPQLKELILPTCSAQNILFVLKDSCFSLKVLRLNKSIDTDSFFNSYGHLDKDRDDDLSLCDYHIENIESDEHLFPFIERHGASKLRRLVLQSCQTSTSKNWSQSPTFAMPNLKDLHLWIYERSPIRPHFSAIMQQSPGVQRLCVELGREDQVSAIPFSAINYMGNLTSLSLRHVDYQDPALLQLLQTYAARDQDSPLSYLEIIAGEECNDASFLNITASIGSLMYLGLTFYDGATEYEDDDVLEFARRIGDLPKLAKLEIDGLQLTKEAAQYIIRCKALKYISSPDLYEEALDILLSSISTVSNGYEVYRK